VTRINWNASQRSENWIEDTISINRRIDDVTNRPRAGDLEQNGVNPGDVIGQQKKALSRKMFASNRRDAIKTAGQAEAQEVECAFTERHRTIVYDLQLVRCQLQSATACRSSNPELARTRRWHSFSELTCSIT
jgi:hypothetical protein